MTDMAGQTECKTIYMSPELRQANESGFRGNREIPIPEVRPQSSHRLNYVQAHDRGLRRSFGSTDLLHNAHPILASDSADSLEGAVLLHADSSGKNIAAVDKPLSITSITPVSLGDQEQPVAGEGKSSKKKKTKLRAGSAEDGEEEENEKWMDASEIDVSTAGGRQEKAEKEEEEEEEEEAAPLPTIGPGGKKHQGMVTPEDATYLQDFHRLPKSLLPSEITHCLHMLEEECRGVEKESENVKWKMEFIHSSMQCVQDTLRTLLIRLVEAQSSDHQSRATTPDLVPPPPLLSTHRCHLPHTSDAATDPHQAGAQSIAHAHAHDPHHHHHHHHHHHLLSQCKTPHPVPSKTCLMDNLNQGHCCQGPVSTDMPTLADMPSCAQRAKERAAVFGAITELRVDVEQLRLAHLEERREQKEVLRVLKDFQRQVEDLISAQQSQQEGSSCEPLSDQLQQLKLEVHEVADMTRQAMAVLTKLGAQLQNMGTETNSKQSNK